MASPEAPEVRADESGGAMAVVISQVFQAAAAKRPRTARKLRGTLALNAPDAKLLVWVRFEGERITVCAPGDEKPDLQVRAPITALAKLGKPREAIKAYRANEVQLKGGVRHPITLDRLRRLLGAF